MPLFYLAIIRLMYGRRAARHALSVYLAIWATVIGGFLLLLLGGAIFGPTDYCHWDPDQHTRQENEQAYPHMFNCE